MERNSQDKFAVKRSSIEATRGSLQFTAATTSSFAMSCFGGTPVALKEEYLKNTPFFLLAAETDDATILPELARYATVKKFNASAQISR